MLYHNSIRKYTLALLSTFNSLKVEYKLSNNTYSSRNIPIKYMSREKATILSELDTKQILAGNTNVLPRANLSLATMIKAEQRKTNKFTKHNVIETGDIKEFTYNAIPYVFTYDLSIICRGMNEASMIIEQIVTMFNPNYTIRVNEVPGQTEPTSIPVSLLDVGIISEEYEDISTNIVTIDVGIEIKGNFYPPVRSLSKLKNVDMYINKWHEEDSNEYNRASLYNYDVVDNAIVSQTFTSFVTDGAFTPVVPVITDILSVDSLSVGQTINLEVIYTDLDNKVSEEIFVWTVTGSSTITTGTKIVALTGVATEIVTVSVQVIDLNGNTSNVFSKLITVV